MRPRYDTEGIVLARSSLAEASSIVHFLTRDLGLIRVRAQAVRASGAKLASAIQTLRECSVILVRGKDVWRLIGATLLNDRFNELSPRARLRAGRIAGLIIRLVRGELRDPALYLTYRTYLDALSLLSESEAENAECLSALHVLGVLGLDAGPLPGEDRPYTTHALSEAESTRKELIRRINRGIAASGL